MRVLDFREMGMDLVYPKTTTPEKKPGKETKSVDDKEATTGRLAGKGSNKGGKNVERNFTCMDQMCDAWVGTPNAYCKDCFADRNQGKNPFRRPQPVMRTGGGTRRGLDTVKEESTGPGKNVNTYHHDKGSLQTQKAGCNKGKDSGKASCGC